MATARALLKQAELNYDLNPVEAGALGLLLGKGPLSTMGIYHGVRGAGASLEADRAAGRTPDTTAALFQGISSGVRGTIGALLGALVGAAAIPMAVRRGKFPPAMLLAAPAAMMGTSTIFGHRWARPQAREEVERDRFSVTPPPGARKLIKQSAMDPDSKRRLKNALATGALYVGGLGAGSATGYFLGKKLAKSGYPVSPALAGGLILGGLAGTGGHLLRNYIRKQKEQGNL